MAEARRLRLLALAAAVSTLACSGQTASSDAPGTPRRVVVMAPAAAEMLEALGLLDRVIAVGEFGPWPANLSGLPVAGGYDSPNVEVVLSLDADAVLTASSQAALEAHRQLERLGVRVLALDTDTWDGTLESIETVGATFGKNVEAQALVAAIRRDVDAIAAVAADLPRRRVLFVVGHDPLYVAGPGSHIDRMIDLAGGVNVASDALSTYQQLSTEAVLERLPEVIVDSSDNGTGATRGRTAGAWGRWEFLPAVADRRVYWIDPSRLAIPGVRLAEMTRLMAQLIHPEAFGEPDAASFGPPADTTAAGRGAAIEASGARP